jgi:hypothetical protein
VTLHATPIVEISFDATGPDTPVTWTDVTEWVRESPGILIVRGRGNERDGINAGTLKFTLKNDDGRFNPRNSAGPYYPDVKPRRPVRVRVEHDAVSETIFQGFIDGGWPQDYATTQSLVPIEAIDALGYLAQTEPEADIYAEAVLADSATLVAWWPFGYTLQQPVERTTSARGTLVSASFSGTEPHVVGSADAQVISFDDLGAQFHTTVTSLFPPNLATTAGSIEFWVRLEADANAVTVPIYIETTGAATASDELIRHRIYIGGVGSSTALGSIYMNVATATGSSSYFSEWRRGGDESGGTDASAYFGDGQPHHVVIASSGSVNGADWAVYVDGTQWHRPVGASSSFTVQNFLSANTSPTVAYVGRDPRVFSNYEGQLIGSVSHLAFYNAKLTREQARAHWLAGSVGRIGDTLDERVAFLADRAGWSKVGTLDASPRRVAEAWIGGEADDALKGLQEVETTEQGRVWCDRQGDLRFSARSWPTTDTASTIVQAEFTDDGTQLPYLADSAVITEDDRQVVNLATVTTALGTVSTERNAASIAEIGKRSKSLTLISAEQKDADGIAQAVVYFGSEAQLRVERISFNPEQRPDELWPLVQTLDEGQLVRVVRNPPAGDTIDLRAHVIGLEHAYQDHEWRTTLVLDGTRADRSWFTWGTSTWGNTSGEGWAF